MREIYVDGIQSEYSFTEPFKYLEELFLELCEFSTILLWFYGVVPERLSLRHLY